MQLNCDLITGREKVMEKFDLYRDIAERTDGDIYTLEW